MSIDRYKLVTRHDPVQREIDYSSGFTVGNGEFAFTVDATGLQTLYDAYREHHNPLCTMSNWGWHTTPAGKDRYRYTYEDYQYTEYDFQGRTVTYAVEAKPGNEEVYEWLRHNPHRMNLIRIAFIYEGREIRPEELKNVEQKLHLWEGVIDSCFTLEGKTCRVKTVCSQKDDTIGIFAESELLGEGKLKILVAFPYSSTDITGSDWNSEERHKTEALSQGQNVYLFKRTLDKDSYQVKLHGTLDFELEAKGKHAWLLRSLGDSMELAFSFSRDQEPALSTFKEALASSREGFLTFWQEGGALDLHRSRDERAMELERRIVLSQYLLRIQCCGSIPPQETGLTCNSWYGKHHLEMYFWHCTWLALWGHVELLEKSFQWYKKILPIARENAARNGYKGARWPKMVGEDGVDSPSTIATLLIWQQPHIIYMLELAYHAKAENEKEKFLEEYWELVEETAEFMADFAVWDEKKQCYNLCPPIIPAQEEHDPKITLNPTYEVEYWRFGLSTALVWARRMKKEVPETWEQVASHMAKLPVCDGLYLAHENCPDTFERYNKDHPSMLMAYGVLPSEEAVPEYMEKTLNKVFDCWNFTTMWGWDFAVMAMTACRCHNPEVGVDILLKDTEKNCYVKSGNNFQRSREDLPLYLPGNGSLLIAAAMMAAGYEGCQSRFPGFPDDGSWTVEYEGIKGFPF